MSALGVDDVRKREEDLVEEGRGHEGHGDEDAEEEDEREDAGDALVAPGEDGEALLEDDGDLVEDVLRVHDHVDEVVVLVLELGDEVRVVAAVVAVVAVVTVVVAHGPVRVAARVALGDEGALGELAVDADGVELALAAAREVARERGEKRREEGGEDPARVPDEHEPQRGVGRRAA